MCLGGTFDLDLDLNLNLKSNRTSNPTRSLVLRGYSSGINRGGVS